MTEQAPLIPDLPIYPEDMARLQERRKKDFQNQLPEQLNRLMNYFRVEASDIYKATGISPSTISGWVNSNVEAQMLDDNIKKVARFFNVSIDYLGFGTPVSEKDIEIENGISEMEEKSKTA